MKKQLQFEIILFSLVCVFLIIPPFFAPMLNPDIGLYNWGLPIKQTIYFLAALILYFVCSFLHFKASLFSLRYCFFFLIGLLLTTFVISRFSNTSLVIEFSGLSRPSDSQEWIFCILTFLFNATFEEIVYRFYLPFALFNILWIGVPNTNWLKKYEVELNFICQIFAAVIFACAHYYLGWPAVINAFITYLLFLYLYKGTGLIWNCVLVHVLYNIITLILF